MELMVFFSWEMETNSQGFNNKKFLITCINKAIKKIHDEKMLKDIKLKLVEGLSDSSGHPIVSEEMMRQVKACHIFVGDMTVVQKLGENTKLDIENNNTYLRKSPNANVLIEYAIALNKSDEFYKQTVLLMNTVNGDVNDDPDLIPFDVRGRRFPITFMLENNVEDSKAKAEKQLLPALIKGLVKAAESAKDYANSKFKPFVSWADHSKNNGFSGSYEWVDSTEAFRDILTGNEKALRVIGLSGMGKTRMVLEAFRGKPEHDHYLYCDVQLQKVDQIYSAASYILGKYPEAILVVDNCKIEVHKTLDGLRKAANGRQRLITIYNDPTEVRDWSCQYIEMPDSLDEVVDRLLARYKDLDQYQEEKQKFRKFAGGNPMIAEMLVNGLRKGKSTGRLDDETLMDKLLGCEKNSDERQMIRALSMFKDVRYDESEETHEEINVITRNKVLIASALHDDALTEKMADTIVHYMERSILEKRGDRIGVRPLVLALTLMAEWMKNCDMGKLKRLINSLQKSAHAKDLIYSFCQQIRLLDKDEQVGGLIEQMLSAKGQFVNVQMMKSELGSELMNAFAQIRPETAANALTGVFGTMSQQDFEGIDDSRSNVVDMVATLCYDKRTFKQAAPMMLRLAMTEPQGEWPDRARTTSASDFLHLFNVPLGPTEADLQDRLAVIKEFINQEEYKELMLLALSKALSFTNIGYGTDAGRQGTRVMKRHKASPQEIYDYVKDCLGVLMSIAEKKDERFLKACEILEVKFRELCQVGAASLVLNNLQRAIILRKNDWDSLLDSLRFYKEELERYLSPTELAMYGGMIESLNRSDFVFRFRRTEKEIMQRSLKKGFIQRQQEQEVAYTQLAVEYTEKHQGDRDLLKQLYETEVISTSPFGSEVAKRMSDGYSRKCFIMESIEIINEIEKPQYGILADFVSELNEWDFEDVVLELDKLKNPMCRFAVIGRGLKSFDHWIMDVLFSEVESGEVKAENFIYLWSNFIISLMKDDDMSQWVKRLGEIPGGKQASLHILQSVVGSNMRDRMPKVIAVAEDIVMTFEQEPIGLMNNYQYWNVSRGLLEYHHNSNLAMVVHRHVLEYIRTIDGFVINNYEVKTTYKLLLGEYFDEIWEELSKALLAGGKDVMMFYQMNDIIGSSYVGMRNDMGLLFEVNHNDELIKWCRENPLLAPARLMEMAPVFDGDKISNIVNRLLKEFGDQQDVLTAFESKYTQATEFGSAIPSDDKLIALLEALKNEIPFEQVKVWADRAIRDIKRAR